MQPKATVFVLRIVAFLGCRRLLLSLALGRRVPSFAVAAPLALLRCRPRPVRPCRVALFALAALALFALALLLALPLACSRLRVR